MVEDYGDGVVVGLVVVVLGVGGGGSRARGVGRRERWTCGRASGG